MATAPEQVDCRMVIRCPAINLFLTGRTNKQKLRILVLQLRNIMIETQLGEFEEVILLLVGILDKDAYAFRIAEEFETQTKRAASIGAVHSALTRLNNKGFVTSKMSSSTAERGGRRKRIYALTAYGRKALQSARDFRMNLWDQYPGFATS